MSNVIACQFVFEPGEYDEEFHRLDGQIDEFASGLEGFISVHRWVSPDGRFKNSIYFFKDMKSVQALAKFIKVLDLGTSRICLLRQISNS